MPRVQSAPQAHALSQSQPELPSAPAQAISRELHPHRPDSALSLAKARSLARAATLPFASDLNPHRPQSALSLATAYRQNRPTPSPLTNSNSRSVEAMILRVHCSEKKRKSLSPTNSLHIDDCSRRLVTFLDTMSTQVKKPRWLLDSGLEHKQHVHDSGGESDCVEANPHDDDDDDPEHENQNDFVQFCKASKKSVKNISDSALPERDIVSIPSIV